MTWHIDIMTFHNSYRFGGWNNNCLFYQRMHWECRCTRAFVSVLWPISNLPKNKTKTRYLSPFKMTFASWKVPYLCLNVCTLTPGPGSSGHIATYIPILYLMWALSRLWRGVTAHVKSTLRSFIDLHLHSPIGGKLFLYVNHRREVTSDKISSFSKEKSQITSSGDYFIVCVWVLYSNL